jgi:RNA polymerase-binding transcription factor DksA
MSTIRLKNFKQRLLDMNQRLTSDIRELAGEIATAGVVVGERSSYLRDSLDAEIAVEQNEEAIQQFVRSALQRIECGTFGQCEDCGGKIAKARLDALPYTPICIKCERKREAT